MVGKTRAQSVKVAGAASTSSKSPPNYIVFRMQQIVSYFEGHTKSRGTIHSKSFKDKVDEITGYCLNHRQRVDKVSLGDLFRCIDNDTIYPRFSTTTYILIFRLIQASEQDHYRYEGLKLLLQAARSMTPGSPAQTKNHDQDLVASRKSLFAAGLGHLLKNSIMAETGDKRSRIIMEAVLTEISQDNDISTTESPLSVGKSTVEPVERSQKSAQGIKRKRDEIPDNFEDHSIFSLPADDDDSAVQEELVSSWSTRKVNLVKFSRDGPKNQAVSSLQKMRRTRTPRVTGKGSPLPTFPKLFTAQRPISKIHQTSLPHGIKQQQQMVKKKDRLQGNPRNSTQPQAQYKSMTDDLHPKRHHVHGNPPEDFQFLPQNTTNIEKDMSTPPPGHQPSPQTRSAPLIADQRELDQYLNLDDDSIIQSHAPENIFSSPAKQKSIHQIVADDGNHPKVKSSSKSNKWSSNHKNQLPSLSLDSLGQVDITDDVSFAVNEAVDRPLQNESVVIISSSSQDNIDSLKQQQSHEKIAAMEWTPSKPQETRDGSTCSDAWAEFLDLSPRNEEEKIVHPQIDGINVKDSNTVILQNRASQELDDEEHNYSKTGNVVVAVPNDIPQIPSIKSSKVTKMEDNETVEAPTQDAASHAVMHHDKANPHLESRLQKRCARLPSHARIVSLDEQLKLRKGSRFRTQRGELASSRKARVLATLHNRGIQTDPDKTLINPVEPDCASHHHPATDQSFEMSSTTTGSRSPTPLTEDNPDNFQKLVESIRGFDDEFPAVIQPAIICLINAVRPLAKVKEVIHKALARYEETVRKLVNSVDAQFCSLHNSHLDSMSSQVELQVKLIAKLKEVCDTRNPLPSVQVNNDLHQLFLIDKAVSSIGV